MERRPSPLLGWREVTGSASADTPPRPEPVRTRDAGRRRRNFPLIDSLRAIAALSVLVFHVTQVTGTGESHSWGAYLMRLNVGVTLFFVISAFLLYRPFVAARMGVGPPVSVRRYLRSRALRILPAYWFALAVLMFIPGALVGVDGQHWWVYFGFLQVYDVHRIVLGIAPAWSLSTEVAFYLFLPAYAWLVARTLGRRSRTSIKGELGLLACLAAAAIILRTAVQHFGFVRILPYTLLGTFAWFSLGLAFALVSVRREADPDSARIVRVTPSLAWGLAVGIYVLACTTLDLPRSSQASGIPNGYTGLQWLGEHVLFLLVAAFLVMPAFLDDGRPSIPQRILGSAPLAWLGKISYGIFLWHVPVLVLVVKHRGSYDWLTFDPFVAKLLITTCVTVACAAFSFYVVEKPFLRMKVPREQAHAAP
jgi:peptidoglycan/LPS O-acetylase OafA/YrhL